MVASLGQDAHPTPTLGGVSTATPPTPVADPVGALFASRTVVEHVVRGVLGLVSAVVSLAAAPQHPAALLGLVGAVALWRGCPTCWCLGLAATLAGRERRCTDGGCPA